MKQNVSLKTYILTILSIVTLFSIMLTGALSSSQIGIVEHSFIKDGSFIIENDDGTYRSFNGQTGALAYSGSNSTTVTRSTLDTLTEERTWKEKVVFKGIFEFSGFEYADCINIPNNTILDFSNALVTIADGFMYEDDHHIFGSTDVVSNIDILNMKFDENYDNAPDGWGYILYFEECYDVTISGCDLRSPEIGYGVIVKAGARVRFENNLVENVGADFYSTETTCTENTIIDDVIDILGDNSVVTCNIGWSSEVRFGLVGDNITFTNNILERSSSGTIVSISCSDSVISHNVFGGIGTVVGVELGGVDVSYNVVSHNVFTYLNIGVLTDGCSISVYHNKINNNILRDCNYGIKLDAGANHNVQLNDFFNCTTGIYINDPNCTIKYNIFEDVTTPIQNLGSDNEIKFNEGYVTENSGSVTVANNEDVAHGLAGTPDVITFSIGNATYDNVPLICSVDWTNTDATNFRVNVYWTNGTAITDDTIFLTWDAIYEP